MSVARQTGSSFRLILASALAVLAVVSLVWLGRLGGRGVPMPAIATTTAPSPNAIRIGLVPERDIFAQRKRFVALTDYLARELEHPVEIVTAAAYQDILQDFDRQAIDAAFLGSFVTILAADRERVRVVARPVLPGEVSTYQGVIIVPDDSPIQRIEDLRGKSLALVKTTFAGHLFPFAELQRAGMLETPPVVKHRWVGTHDEVALMVAEGRADAGALKSLRLDDYERQPGSKRFRRLASSKEAPENALVVRAGLDESMVSRLCDTLLTMKDSDSGRQALETFGAVRFEPCSLSDYRSVYDLVDSLGDSWPAMGISGPPPRMPPQ